MHKEKCKWFDWKKGHFTWGYLRTNPTSWVVFSFPKHDGTLKRCLLIHLDRVGACGNFGTMSFLLHACVIEQTTLYEEMVLM